MRPAATLSRGRVPLAVAAIVVAAAAAAPRAEPAARASRATLATFAGRWTGHTRSLKVHPDGRATESLASGCCSPVLNLTFVLSHPRGASRDATAHMRVTGVWVRDRTAFDPRHPAPHVGETGTLRLKHGVIHEPLTGTDYCSTGGRTCGA